jgi:hypothetical protein
MKSLYYKLITTLFFALAFAGCKLDPPVYPEGTISTVGKGKTSGIGMGTGTGTVNTNDGAGLPIGATATIQVQVDGGTILDYGNISSFDVALPGSPDAVGSANGQTGIMGSLEANVFSLVFDDSSAGTYDILDLNFANYSSVTKSDGSGKGRIKVTVLTPNQIEGTFNSDVADDQGVIHHVIGSFNISK